MKYQSMKYRIESEMAQSAIEICNQCKYQCQ
jgi:hypothetical protein